MAESELQLPAVFGRYLLLRRLSRGGMGEIYLAKAGDVRGFEKLFIIKKILPHLVKDENFVRRFTEEAQIAIKLNHINIAPVFEVGMMEGELFLALEYVEGRDLRRILSKCHELGIQVPQDLALAIAREVANGLAYAHRRTDDQGRALELVHCDISPPNILVSYEGEVKIIDFGVARSAAQLQEDEPTTGFGKLGYMSPEQLLKGRVVDQRTDLYALGVMLYEMLVGDRMIELDPKADHRLNVRKIVLDPVVPPSQRVAALDPRLDEVVLKAVAKDPKDRFQDATAFRTQLQVLLSDINPAHSPDDLGHFIKETFIDEQEQERSLLQEASAMDLAPFMDQLHDAGEATVSYAMTNLWEVPPPPPESNVAAQVISDPLLLAQSRRTGVSGWVWGALAGVVAVIVAVVTAVLLWPSDDGGSASAAAGNEEGGTEVAAAAGPDAGAPGKVEPVRVDGSAARPSRDATEARSRRVARRARTRRARTRRRRRPRRGRPMKPSRKPPREDGKDKKEDGVDPVAVNRKFRRVKSQYKRFRSRYGHRLEKRWQAILRTAVYSGSDKYKRLDSMLDGLRHRMAAIRKKEGE
jgi:serine/threonine protein kinase